MHRCDWVSCESGTWNRGGYPVFGYYLMFKYCSIVSGESNTFDPKRLEECLRHTHIVWSSMVWNVSNEHILHSCISYAVIWYQFRCDCTTNIWHLNNESWNCIQHQLFSTKNLILFYHPSYRQTFEHEISVCKMWNSLLYWLNRIYEIIKN